MAAWIVFANAMKVDDKILGPNLSNPGPTASSPPRHANNSTQNTDKDEYTIEEVSKHVTGEDLWLIIDNKVYNMTKYLKYHPGKDILYRKNKRMIVL